MKKIVYQILSLLLIISCNNKSIGSAQILENNFQFCNSELIFSNDSNTVIINIYADSGKSNKKLKEFFDCIEKEIVKNEILNNAFVKQSKTIKINLSIMNSGYYHNMDTNRSTLYLELINLANDFEMWPDRQVSGQEFINFVKKTGYTKSWENCFNNLLHSSIKWTYEVENIKFLYLDKKIEKYKKNIYPLSFEILLKRE